MNHFKSEEDFGKDLRRFNALISKFPSWKPTKARKKHTDKFGKKIEEGEVYFKRSYGLGDDVLKLSRESMEQVLFVIFFRNSGLSDLADELIKERMEELTAKLDSSQETGN